MEKRYHIRVLLIRDYSELPEVLFELKEAINKKNIFFSGVFERLPGQEDVFAEKLCKCLTTSLHTPDQQLHLHGILAPPSRKGAPLHESKERDLYNWRSTGNCDYINWRSHHAKLSGDLETG